MTWAGFSRPGNGDSPAASRTSRAGTPGGPAGRAGTSTCRRHSHARIRGEGAAAPLRRPGDGLGRRATRGTDTARLDNGWCKLPADADTNVRGARNQPCPNGIRSATAAGCGYDFSAKPVTTLTAYDPRTGQFRGPDGRMYTIDLKAKNTAGVSPFTSGLLTAVQAKG